MTRSYRDLMALDDAALRREGWARNDRGGLSRLPAAARRGLWRWVRNVLWRAWGFLRGMSSAEVPAGLAVARWKVCAACQEKDSHGARLFRGGAGGHYCGEPGYLAPGSDPLANGCGCLLEAKVCRSNTECPRRKWRRYRRGAVKRLPSPDSGQSRPIPAVPAQTRPQTTIDAQFGRVPFIIIRGPKGDVVVPCDAAGTPLPHANARQRAISASPTLHTRNGQITRQTQTGTQRRGSLT
jgi:hypothetical protein